MSLVDGIGMRFRQRDERTTVQGSGYDYYNHAWNGSSWIPNTVIHYGDSGVLCGNLKSILDTPHPNFARRKAMGQVILGDLRIINSSRTGSITSFTLGPYYHSNPTLWPHGYREVVNVNAGPLIDNVAPATTLNLKMDGESMKQIALAKAYAKIEASATLSGETLSDLDQTVSMLHRPFGGARDLLGRMIKNKRRHLGKTAVSAARAISNTWLEYRYGWRPLILDIHNVSEEIRTLRAKLERKRLVVRAGESNVLEDVKTFTQRPLTWNSSWKLSGEIRYTSEYRVHAGVIFDVVSVDKLQELNRIIGFRPNDFVSTAWEIVPYSFVIDWFVNIGPWLQAVTPVPGVTITGSWITTVWSYTKLASSGTIHVSLSVPSPIVETRPYSGYSLFENVVERTVNPSLAAHPVVIAKKLSPLHSLDGVALSLGRINSLWRDFRRK